MLLREHPNVNTITTETGFTEFEKELSFEEHNFQLAVGFQNKKTFEHVKFPETIGTVIFEQKRRRMNGTDFLPGDKTVDIPSIDCVYDEHFHWMEKK